MSVDFTTNMLSELVLDRFGKQEGLYKSISLSFVLLEITERKILMSATENATVLNVNVDVSSNRIMTPYSPHTFS